jgi:hypothetical protein
LRTFWANRENAIPAKWKMCDEETATAKERGKGGSLPRGELPRGDSRRTLADRRRPSGACRSQNAAQAFGAHAARAFSRSENAQHGEALSESRHKSEKRIQKRARFFKRALKEPARVLAQALSAIARIAAQDSDFERADRHNNQSA